MRYLATALLLIATLSSSTILAAPVAAASFRDIERSWSEGQSEVCLETLPGCYVSAWWQSMVRRAQIHSRHTFSRAAPSWVAAGRRAEITSREAFESTTDERTMRARENARRSSAIFSEGLMARIERFAQEFMRSIGEPGMIDARATREEAAPVLQPRRGMRYQYIDRSA